MKTAGKALLVATGAAALGYVAKTAYGLLTARKAMKDFGNHLMDNAEQIDVKKLKNEKKNVIVGVKLVKNRDGDGYSVDLTEQPYIQARTGTDG